MFGGKVTTLLKRVFPRVEPLDPGDKKALEDTYWRLKDELIPEAEALLAHLTDFGTGACNDLNDREVEGLVVSAFTGAKETLAQLNSLRVRLINMLGYVPDE